MQVTFTIYNLIGRNHKKIYQFPYGGEELESEKSVKISLAAALGMKSAATSQLQEIKRENTKKQGNKETLVYGQRNRKQRGQAAWGRRRGYIAVLSRAHVGPMHRITNLSEMVRFGFLGYGPIAFLVQPFYIY